MQGAVRGTRTAEREDGARRVPAIRRDEVPNTQYLGQSFPEFLFSLSANILFHRETEIPLRVQPYVPPPLPVNPPVQMGMRAQPQVPLPRIDRPDQHVQQNLQRNVPRRPDER